MPGTPPRGCHQRVMTSLSERSLGISSYPVSSLIKAVHPYSSAVRFNGVLEVQLVMDSNDARIPQQHAVRACVRLRRWNHGGLSAASASWHPSCPIFHRPATQWLQLCDFTPTHVRPFRSTAPAWMEPGICANLVLKWRLDQGRGSCVRSMGSVTCYMGELGRMIRNHVLHDALNESINKRSKYWTHGPHFFPRWFWAWWSRTQNRSFMKTEMVNGAEANLHWTESSPILLVNALSPPLYLQLSSTSHPDAHTPKQITHSVGCV